jgi:hypothetical protein
MTRLAVHSKPYLEESPMQHLVQSAMWRRAVQFNHGPIPIIL